MTDDAVVQSRRRTWDLEAARRRAEELEREGNPKDRLPSREEIASRAPLQARQRGVMEELASQIGKTQVINANAPLTSVGGFYCKVCKCTIKDSINYLDHINGRKHQAALGVSMKTERATLEDVKARLNAHKRKHEEIKKYDLDERVKQLQEMEAEEKRLKKERKKRQKQKETSSAEEEITYEAEIDPALAAMGLPTGFGSSKK